MYSEEILAVYEAIKVKESVYSEQLGQVQANIKKLQDHETELEDQVEYYQEKRDEAWALYNLSKKL